MSQKSLTIGILSNYLNTLLDVNNFSENVINGIQVENTANLSKIATAVSASLETIEETVKMGAKALIVHHGLFTKSDLSPITDVKYKKIKKLIENNIALLCYHLPLDAHQEIGNNWKAAKDLYLENLQPFLEYNKTLIGVIGNIKPLSFEDFKKKVETYYENSANSVKVKDNIRSVAIVSGAADKFIKEAALAGADCFITERVDEQVWDDAHENNISFLGLGHYCTEKVGPKALAEHIQNTFNIQCDFIETKNPF